MEDDLSSSLGSVKELWHRCLRYDEAAKLEEFFQQKNFLPASLPASANKDSRKGIVANSHGRVENIVSEILRPIQDGTVKGITKEYFASVCESEEFPGGKYVAQLTRKLLYISREKSQYFNKLLSRWNELLERTNEVMKFVEKNMPQSSDVSLRTQDISTSDRLALLFIDLTNLEPTQLESFSDKLWKLLDTTPYVESTNTAGTTGKIPQYPTNPQPDTASAILAMARSESDSTELKNWLETSRQHIKRLRTELCSLAMQAFEDKEITEESLWPDHYIKKLNEVEDESFFVARVLEIKQVVEQNLSETERDVFYDAKSGETSMSPTHSARNDSPPVDRPVYAKSFRLEKNEPLIMKYSHSVRIFVEDTFSKEKWFDANAKDHKSLMRALVDHCKSHKEHENVKHFLDFMGRRSEQPFEFENERAGDEEFVTVQFRVLLVHKNQLKQSKVLEKYKGVVKMWTNSNVKDEIQMIQRGHYFYWDLKLKKGDTILYRFFTYTGPEYLNGSTTSTINRSFQVPLVHSDRKIINFDFAHLDSECSSSKLLHEHLPLVETIDERPKPTEEVVLWVRYMKSKLFLKRYEERQDDRQETLLPYTIENDKIENALEEWAGKVLSRSSSVDQRHEVVSGHITSVFVGCAIAKSFFANKYSISKPELLSHIFCLMKTDQLDESELGTLYGKLLAVDGVFPEKRGASETFLGLFLSPHITPKFLTALPLYWLIVNDGKIGSGSRDTALDDTLEKQCWLSSPTQPTWKQRHKRFDQSKLLDLKNDISKMSGLHPWLIKTYFYFMTPESIMKFLDWTPCNVDLEFVFLFPLLDLTGVNDKTKLKKFISMLKNKAENQASCLSKGSGIAKKLIDSINKTLQTLATKEVNPSFRRILLFCAESSMLFFHADVDDSTREIFQETVELICKCLMVAGAKEDQIGVWDTLLKLNWGGEDKLLQMLLDTMKNSIVKTWNNKEKECIQFYIKNVMDSGMQENLAEIFDRIAEDYFAKSLKGVKEDDRDTTQKGIKEVLKSFIDHFRDSKHKLLMKFFGSFLRRKLYKYKDVNFLLEWPYACAFVELLDVEHLEGFDEDTSKEFLSRIDCFKTSIWSLLSHSIGRVEFEMLRKNTEKVLNLCEILKENRVEIEKALSMWSAALDEFDSRIRKIDSFVKACQNMSVGGLSVVATELEMTLPTEIQSMHISDIGAIQDNGIVCYKLPLKVEAFETMEKNAMPQGNNRYAMTWRKMFADEKHELSLEKFYSEILIPAQEHLEKLAKSMEDGTLRLSEISEMFDNESITEDFVLQQLKHLFSFCGIDCIDDSKLQIRSGQIIACIQNKILLEMNKRFRKTVRVLEIEGNFSEFDIIQEDWFERDLNNMLASCFEDKWIFEKKHLAVLQAFLDQKEFASCLIKRIKSNDDMITLGNLAFCHAKDCMEFDRITTLQSAVKGFSPLIYDWPNQSKFRTSQELVKRFFEVFKNYEKSIAQNKNNLLNKWAKAGSHLSWVNEVIEIYGSSGKQAMRSVQEINESAQYIIRRISDESYTFNNYVELKLDDKNIQPYTWLQDLQSKIILIAGEIEKTFEVDMFVNLLSVVENLVQACMDLSESGCLLFEDLTMTIGHRENMSSMPEAKEWKFSITVSMHKDLPPLTGKVPIETIEDITRVLRRILERWNNHFENSLKKHYFLSEYSTAQITYLCKELGYDGEIVKLTDQASMLLRRITPCLTEADVNIAREKAMRYVDYNHDSSMHAAGDRAPQSDIDKIKDTVRKLHFESNFSEKTAKAAVQISGTNLRKCRRWVLQNSEKKDLICKLSAELDEKLALSHRDREIEANYDILHERANRTLQHIIKSLQDRRHEDELPRSIVAIYEIFMKEAGSWTIDGLLNLEHFGRFLTLIAVESLPKRKLPEPLRKGLPNIVIRAEEDIPSTALAIYAAQTNGPLPTTSEVLWCRENTTTMEVERFFCRALLRCPSKGSRIYCLAAAHKLTSKVSQLAGDHFYRLNRHQINTDYQLIILSSDRSHHLSTCFEQGIIASMPTVSNTTLADYLKKNLTCSMPGNIHKSSVKVVLSYRSGMGKSLHIRRLREKTFRVARDQVTFTTVRFMEKLLNVDLFTEKLALDSGRVKHQQNHFIHLDFTPAIKDGLLHFVFNLLILGGIEDSKGRVWRRSEKHFYAVEVTKVEKSHNMKMAFQFLKMLPSVRCLSPREIAEKSFQGLEMDKQELQSEYFQRPSQYLLKFNETPKNMEVFEFQNTRRDAQVDQIECIRILLRYCSVQNPSWAQLRNFSKFLNLQLENCEKSFFCNKQLSPELRELKAFAVRYMILMAQDFATPSLEMSDTSKQDGDLLRQHDLRRKWETASHPFVFFNDDGHSMTFINVDSSSNSDEAAIISDLMNQGIAINEKFENLTRKEKLRVLCKVMGVPFKDRRMSGKWTGLLKQIGADGKVKITHRGKKHHINAVSEKHLGLLQEYKKYPAGLFFGNRFEHVEEMFQEIIDTEQLEEAFELKFIPTEIYDPDPTYEISMNNALKMLAMYMRLRCDIPVIIMGETGCGKTRMIKFMSELKRDKSNYKNLKTLRVHGGTTVCDVQNFVQNSGKLVPIDPSAELGAEEAIDNGPIVVFFDEANTTEAIYAIKEALCDTYNQDSNHKKHLWIIAACNPYKTLSENAVAKLKKSGLGYRVDEEASEHLGAVPMRFLVYRVVALPPSIQPLVWDFGQLTEPEEKCYIHSMITKLACEMDISAEQREQLAYLLCGTQKFMRSLPDECKYVSMRDIERCVIAYKWFAAQGNSLFRGNTVLKHHVRVMLHALGLCYHSSLEKRSEFRHNVCRILNVEGFGESDYLEELIKVQRLITSKMDVGENIALNAALVENVFMITVCADMKIPLFLVGSPGSSKSLAKSIVAKNMVDGRNRDILFKHFKSIDIKSFQCSWLTEADEIESVFKQCMQYQAQYPLDEYVSVITLDEIGLAEDSPHMPLKILHSLLESGSVIDDDLGSRHDPSKKIGFLGISNWALDPAKLNRGIFTTRAKPDDSELIETISGIFSDCREIVTNVKRVVEALVKAYLVVTRTPEFGEEYFGLRDLYSTMKMVKTSINRHQHHALSMDDVMHAVIRNFSGGRKPCIDIFKQELEKLDMFSEKTYSSKSISNILDANLETNNRYLLLLCKKYFALNLLRKATGEKRHFRVIFGSAFPGDKHRAAQFRNISRIKVCMETDCTVIILNMREIHESLYDALNQHYETMGKQKYVDLGLGSSKHRVKVRVHDDFRMILVEDAEIVYKQYPAPLVNRLEKHHFDPQKLLTDSQAKEAKELKIWSCAFSTITAKPVFSKSDTFSGYHRNTENSLVLLFDLNNSEREKKLLQSATMDGVVRLVNSAMAKKAKIIQNTYFVEQQHESLSSFLRTALEADDGGVKLFEVITFSSTLTELDRENLVKHLLRDTEVDVQLVSLHQLDTLQQFSNKLEFFFKTAKKNAEAEKPIILMVQCMSAHKKNSLVSCAWHCLEDMLAQYEDLNMIYRKEKKITTKRKPLLILFLLSIDRKSSGIERTFGLQYKSSGETVYIDELRRSSPIGNCDRYLSTPISKVFREALSRLTTSHTPNDDFCNPVLNIQALLEGCLCEALTLTASSRNEKIVKILSEIIGQKDFRDRLLEKIVHIFEQKHIVQMNFQRDSTKWIIGEACNEKNLQEAGTFRKTVWLYLKKEFSVVVAYVTSVIDANSNLDFFDNKSPDIEACMRKLWMSIFKVIPLRWEYMKKKTKFPREEVAGMKPSFPFSWHIYNKITEMWNTSAQELSISAFLNDWDVMHLVRDVCAEEGQKTLRCLIHDMVRIGYRRETEKQEKKTDEKTRRERTDTESKPNAETTTGGERNSNVEIGATAEEKSRRKQTDTESQPTTETTIGAEPNSKDEIRATAEEQKKALDAVTYIALTWTMGHICQENPSFRDIKTTIFRFLCMQKYFKRLSEVFKNWPKMINESHVWVKDISSEKEVLDNAFAAVCQTLLKGINEIGGAEACSKWMQDVKSAEKVFQPPGEMNIIKNDHWKQIYLLHLLLTQLMPSDPVTEFQKMQFEIIASQAKEMGYLLFGEVDGDGIDDPDDVESFTIICAILAECIKKIKQRMLVSLSELKCLFCHNDITDARKLACSHYLCGNCVDNVEMESCPKCDEKIDKSNACSPSLSIEQQIELKDLRLKCTLFLLNYVRDLQMFTHMDTDRKSLIDIILRLIIHFDDDAGKQLDRAAFNSNLMSIKSLITFATRFDEQYTLKEINGAIQTDTCDTSRTTVECVMQALMLYFSYTIQTNSENKKLMGLVQKVWASNEMSVDVLKWIAILRVGLQKLAVQVHETDNLEKVLEDVMKLVQRDESELLRLYFLKYGSYTFGRKWLQKIMDSKHSIIFLAKLGEASAQSVDLWRMLGKAYEDGILSASDKYCQDLLKVNSIQKLIGFADILASISVALKTPKHQLQVVRILRSHSTSDVSIPRMLSNLVELFSERGSVDKHLSRLLALVAIAVCKQDYLINEFKAILQNPNEIKKRFLPTMPESVYFSLPEEYRKRYENYFGDMVTHMFTCPNGHMYMIDGCTRPQELYICPECQADIGGENDNLVAGNKEHEEKEENQAGYILDKPESQQQPDDLELRMSKHGVAFTRFLLHACILFVTHQNESLAKEISHAENVTHDSFVSYLFHQLEQNIGDLATSLSINNEDAQLVIFKILEHIIETKVSADDRGNTAECHWSSMTARKKWEEKFYNLLLRPVFQNAENLIAEGWKVINDTGLLYKLQHDLVGKKIENKPWTNPSLWLIMKPPSVEHLLQFVKDSKQHTAETLQTLLERQQRLEILRFLKPVIDLQAMLIRRYQYRLDRTDADKISFLNVLKENETDIKLKELIDRYFEAWTAIQREYKLVHAPETLDVTSPISFALPNKHGNGKFAIFLSCKLIEWQNNFLETCERRVSTRNKLIKRQNKLLETCKSRVSKLKFEKVSVSDLQESHIVDIVKRNEFLDVIAIHTKYDIAHNDKDGSTHHVTYNIEALERMVREKYVKHKRLIESKTLPSVRYAQDVGISEDWPVLKKNVEQENLPPELQSSVASNCEMKTDDALCEAVRTVSYAISFLAMTTSKPDTSLKDYMVDILLLEEHRMSVIPRSIQIKHTLSLYLHLTLHKAVEFVKKGIDPYRDTLLEGQEPIPEKLRDTLKKELSNTNVELLLKRINETLINKTDYEKSYSLIKSIFPYVEYLDGDKNRCWFANLPKELRFVHITDLFRITVKFMETGEIVGDTSAEPSERDEEATGIEQVEQESYDAHSASMEYSTMEQTMTKTEVKEGNFAVVKSTQKSIGLDEGTLRLFDCNVTFPKRSFQVPTAVSTIAEIDSSKWPRSFIAFTPTLYVHATGLQQAASVELPSWCINDGSDEGKEATVDVLHLPEGSNEWRVVTSLPLISVPVFKFDCPDFSPVLVGVWERFLGRHLFLVTGSIYASAYNELTLLLHLHNDLISDRLQRDMESEAHPKRRALRLNVYEAKQDDQIEFSLQIPDQGGFQLDPPGPFRFPINHNFIRCNPVMRHTVILSEAAANRVIPIRCTISKEDEIIDGPHAFTHRWTLDPETPPPQPRTVNYNVTTGVFASEGGHASATYQDSAIAVGPAGEHPAVEENDEDQNEDDQPPVDE